MASAAVAALFSGLRIGGGDMPTGLPTSPVEIMDLPATMVTYIVNLLPSGR